MARTQRTLQKSQLDPIRHSAQNEAFGPPSDGIISRNQLQESSQAELKLPPVKSSLGRRIKLIKATMAQDNAKTHKGPAQKHLHSRISYLYQAATHLARSADQLQVRTDGVNIEAKEQSKPDEELQCAVTSHKAVSVLGLPKPPTELVNRIRKICTHDDRNIGKLSHSRQLVVHLRAISLKSQIRLSPAMKHTICKRCDALLIPGSTSTSYMENNSRGGRKPWADVLVTTCAGCGTAKRFPMGAKRQLRREPRTGESRNMRKEGHHAVYCDNGS